MPPKRSASLSGPSRSSDERAPRRCLTPSGAETRNATTRTPLTPSSIFCRIRPITTTGDCAHTDGEAVNKKLDSWDEVSVTMQDDDRREMTRFRFTGVIPPDVENEAAYDIMMTDLVEAFHRDSHVHFFAYGQTGSGKTHTMLGTVDSLSSPEPVPGWGIFPRVVHATLDFMRHAEEQEGVQSVLYAAAVEFYCCAGWDLSATPKSEVTIDKEANIFGVRSTQITCCDQLRDWISSMYANRCTAKTAMNDASSRSHCAFVLTLHQVRRAGSSSSDGEDFEYLRTTFSLVDMAGSERLSKTGGEQRIGYEAFVEASRCWLGGTPDAVSIGAQGWLINYELSFIATEIKKAADAHRKRMKFSAVQSCSTAASFYFSACADGRCRLGACVTVSQSPQHGFESWFSMKYGEQLAECRAPIRPVKPVPLQKALTQSQALAEKAVQALEQSPAKPNGPKQERIVVLKRGAVVNSAQNLQILTDLAARVGVHF